MAAAFALTAILVSVLAAGLLWPLMGWRSLLLVPFAGSAAALGMGLAVSRMRRRDLDEGARAPDDTRIDALVLQLRGILARAADIDAGNGRPAGGPSSPMTRDGRRISS